MLTGATGKRFYYFMSSFFRLIGFLSLLIAFIVVKITVKPGIEWLNLLLLCLSLGSLMSGLLNLSMCGMPATGYKTSRAIQIFCLVLTIITGGILGTVFTSLAFAQKVTDEEVENENIVKIKKHRGK